MSLESAGFMIELAHGIIAIKDVPTNICPKCGQRSYKDDVARQLERIRVGLRGEALEVAVVRFSE